MEANKIAFMVGSGISRDSGAPMVGDITEKVLSSPWQSHTDSRFYSLNPEEHHVSDAYTKKIQDLISILHHHIKDRIALKERRQPNYEDYFACLKQMIQDETFEIVNPLIQADLNEFKKATSLLWIDIHPHIDNNAFASLAERATDFIQCVVRASLADIIVPQGLSLFVEAAQHFESIDIFSLNHDLLIERLYEIKGLPYLDGFGEKEGDSLMFSSNWNKSESVTRLFKLHGSIDWYYVDFETRGFRQFAKIRNDVDHAKDGADHWINILQGIPNFLTGVTVKEQAYGIGLYGELFSQLRHRLGSHRYLVCSGYGWSDKGINIRIKQWLFENRENTVIILHGDGGENLSQKRFWYWEWDKLINSGKVVLIPKWFSQCTLDDILTCVD